MYNPSRNMKRHRVVSSFGSKDPVSRQTELIAQQRRDTFNASIALNKVSEHPLYEAGSIAEIVAKLIIDCYPSSTKDSSRSKTKVAVDRGTARFRARDPRRARENLAAINDGETIARDCLKAGAQLYSSTE